MSLGDSDVEERYGDSNLPGSSQREVHEGSMNKSDFAEQAPLTGYT